jgi:RNA polymerase sigma factor for flagellar operon FliA
MNYDKETLISTHLDLAKHIAMNEWRTAPHALNRDDMLGLAYFGLVDAADRWEAYCSRKSYDPAAVQFFKAFAGLRIRGTIRDQIRRDDWTTRTVRSKSKKLKDAGQDEGLSIEELAERTNMTVTEINKVTARLSQRPVSLDSRLTNQDQGQGLPADTDFQLKEDVDTEGRAFANEMITVFVDTVKSLSFDIQVVLALRYYTRLEMRKIAEELEIPETRVMQLHHAGVLAVKQELMRAAMERG